MVTRAERLRYFIHNLLGDAGSAGVVAPLPIAAYTGVHFVGFIGIGIVFFVLLVAFLSLSAGFFVLDIALGAQLTGKLSTWSIMVANLLAAAGMAFYQHRRHPGALQKVDRLWVDEDDEA